MIWIDQVVHATLVLPMTYPEYIRNLYVSKQLRAPFSIMDKIVQARIDGKPENVPKTKMILYSTHDWTVAQSVVFFKADNGDFLNLPFASYLSIELHANIPKDETYELNVDDFWVEVHYNGRNYKFTDHCDIADRCSYREFNDMLKDVLSYVYTSTNYQAECAADQKLKYLYGHH